MLRNLLLAAFALLCASVAHATGVLLAPPEIASHYFLDTETAVIAVRADRTATTDLFLSLRTSSRGPDPVSLVIPLQTTPQTYQAEGTNRKQFQEAYVSDVSALPGRAEEEWRHACRALRETCDLSSLLAGPCALPLVGSVAPREPPFVDYAPTTPSVERHPPVGTLPVLARSVSAEVHPSLRVSDLLTLAHVAELPARAQQVLAAYAGHPFLLVRLWCVPDPSEPSPDVPERYEQPGLHVSFSQVMLPGADASAQNYTFPLRTLAAWPSLPYYLELYVTSPESLNLRVGRPGQRPESDSDAWRYGPDPHTAAWNGRQVIFTS